MRQRDDKRIVIGDGAPEAQTWLELLLRRQGYQVVPARDAGHVMRLLRGGHPAAAVLLDVSLAQPDGMKALRAIRVGYPGLPVIIVSDPLPASTTLKMMENGATDFLRKPATPDELAAVLRRAAEKGTRTPAGTPDAQAADFFFGTSPRMLELQAVAAHVGMSDAAILIQGETGCGKEMLARHIYGLGRRGDKPLLKVNCGALPTHELERELFGSEAPGNKPGVLRSADGAAALLEDIEYLDPKIQARLLSVLQDRESGAREPLAMAPRVFAVTRTDLRRAVSSGKFRDDLYYCLSVITLTVPPLRERREDILTLAEILLKKHTPPRSTPPDLMSPLRKELLRYEWPGNVRELENIMRRLCILRDGELVARELAGYSSAFGAPCPAETPDTGISKPAPAPPSPVIPPLRDLAKASEQAEIDAILAALNTTWWNRKRAARLLHIGYKALLYRMKKLGIEDIVPAPEPEPMVRMAGQE